MRQRGGPGEPPSYEEHRRPLPVSGGAGRGLPALSVPLGAFSSFYSFLSLQLPPLSDPPPSLCCCYSSPRFLPSLPADTAEPEARPERTEPRPFLRCPSLSPQSRMSSIQNLQSFGKSRHPACPLYRKEPLQSPPPSPNPPRGCGRPGIASSARCPCCRPPAPPPLPRAPEGTLKLSLSGCRPRCRRRSLRPLVLVLPRQKL